MSQPSVTVMRSHDYCHFEITLEVPPNTKPEVVDNLRKDAAILADKAVDQYKQAKAFESWKTNNEFARKQLRKECRVLKENYPKSEWTPEQTAKVKLLADFDFHFDRAYSYQDDWDDDYPQF